MKRGQKLLDHLSSKVKAAATCFSTNETCPGERASAVGKNITEHGENPLSTNYLGTSFWNLSYLFLGGLKDLSIDQRRRRTPESWFCLRHSESLGEVT